jgi:hypothetical protein
MEAASHWQSPVFLAYCVGCLSGDIPDILLGYTSWIPRAVCQLAHLVSSACCNTTQPVTILITIIVPWSRQNSRMGLRAAFALGIHCHSLLASPRHNVIHGLTRAIVET